MVIPTFEEWLETAVNVDCGFTFTNASYIPPGQLGTAERVYNSVIAMINKSKEQ